MKSSLRVVRYTTRIFFSLFAIGLSLAVLLKPAQASDEPKWIRMSSAHFNMLTDVGPPRGEQAILRLEQMRSVIGHQLMKSKMHLSLPLDIIAVKSDDEYIQIAPVRDGRPISSTGFFLHGDEFFAGLRLTNIDNFKPVLGIFLHIPVAAYFGHCSSPLKRSTVCPRICRSSYPSAAATLHLSSILCAV